MNVRPERVRTWWAAWSWGRERGLDPVVKSRGSHAPRSGPRRTLVTVVSLLSSKAPLPKPALVP